MMMERYLELQKWIYQKTEKQNKQTAVIHKAKRLPKMKKTEIR
jgi:hypothetical protein